MKILYYSPHPQLNLASASGYGTHMREMIAAFERAGHKVRPLIMGGTETFKTSAGATSTSAKTTATPPGIGARRRVRKRLRRMVPPLMWETLKDARLLRFDAKAARELERVTRDWKPDLVYERAAYLSSGGVRVARKLGVRHVLEINAPYVEEQRTLTGAGSLWRQHAARVERELLQGTSLPIVVSSALRDYFVQRCDVKRERFLVLPNAISSTFARTDADIVEKLRAELGLQGCTIVGFVGSIFPWHGVDVLLDAMTPLLRENAFLRLLIVGDGAILPDLRAQAARANVANQTIFTGSVAHASVPGYIALMDVATLARSHWYGSPVKIFEYAALGRAVIAPDNVPVRDVMTPGEDGLLVPPVPESVRAALQELLQNPDKRCALGANWERKVRQFHTWDENARRVLQRVQTLSAPPRKRSF